MSIKLIDDTMGPKVLVPSLLLYGVLPSFPEPTKTRIIQKEGLQAQK